MPTGPERPPRRPNVVSAVEVAFRTEWAPLVATMTRELRDLQLAEDVVADAFGEAATAWRRTGVPDRPGGWLLTCARRRAIDTLRRRRRFDERIAQLAALSERHVPDRRQVVDDQLALLFGCCHPALAVDAQVALTLRVVGGLTTEQIAHAFLVPVATMQKRLTRAKHKIAHAGVPIAVPDRERLPERIDGVCGVVYAVFTEGHASSAGPTLLRGDLCDEAIWLAETLTELLPDHAEVRSLAALCLLTDARRPARFDGDGLPVLLADQDRTRWDQSKIRRGLAHLGAAAVDADVGPYRLRAALAALHSSARTAAETDWAAILRVYDVIVAHGGGPIAELNRAVAVAEAEGPDAGLAALVPLLTHDSLMSNHYLHGAHAELLHRLGRDDEATSALRLALAHCDNDPERAWLRRRLAEFAAPSGSVRSGSAGAGRRSASG